MVDPEHVGTRQHRQARDMSEYLIHMAKTPEDLASILTHGVIEARTPFGVGGGYTQVRDKHKVVCLTEMPVAELSRMTSRGRSFGVAFKRDLLRERAGAQPVWYLDHDSAPHRAIETRMTELATSGRWEDPFWEITPYVDTVEDGRRDWRWEREWRVQGDFRFDLYEVALVIVLGGKSDDRGVFERVDLGSAVYDPDGGFFWASGSLEALGPSMELLIDKFHETYETPDDAALPYDDESEHGYYPLVDIHTTDEALEWIYDDLPVEVRVALGEHLDGQSMLWCRSSDVASWMEPEDDDDAYYDQKYGLGDN